MAGITSNLSADEAAELEIDLKYEGYIKRQAEMVERSRRLENALIPESIDYWSISGLSIEIRERLSAAKPRSLGQAARTPGVTPAAISLIAVHLRGRRNRTAAVSAADS
jgi:tRNA uridine 5-carboxymethylaminomethyl modification enzyme